MIYIAFALCWNKSVSGVGLPLNVSRCFDSITSTALLASYLAVAITLASQLFEMLTMAV